MTKRDKQFTKLLNQKTLSSSETIRLLQLDGWVEDKGNPTDGSHYHLEHPVKQGKITVPLGRKALKKLTRDSILRAANLI